MNQKVMIGVGVVIAIVVIIVVITMTSGKGDTPSVGPTPGPTPDVETEPEPETEPETDSEPEPEPKPPSWEDMGKSLVQIDVDGTTVCGVNDKHEVYCNENGEWKRVDGSMKHVSVDNGRLYGLEASSSKVFFSPNTLGDWNVESRGRFDKIDFDENKVCAITRGKDVWCKDKVDGTDWYKVGVRLKDIAVSNNRLVGVTRDNEIRYYTDTKGEMKTIQGEMKRVDIRGNKVCGIDTKNDIHCKETPTSGEWNKVDGNLKYISIGSEKLYGIDDSGKVKLL